MKLLLHALSVAEVPREIPGGLRGQALVRVDSAGLAAWATELAEPDPRFGRSDLLEHHAIISCLHAQLAACLPVRFPTWFVDADALRGEIGRRQDEFRANLDAVRGRCELAVTVLWTAPAETAESETPSAAAATPGTRYLLERQQAVAGSDRRRARARALADEVKALAGVDLAGVRAHVCPSALVAVSSALLIPRESAEALIARLPRAKDGVRILVNGPWPPYSFAGTGEREA